MTIRPESVIIKISKLRILQNRIIIKISIFCINFAISSDINSRKKSIGRTSWRVQNFLRISYRPKQKSCRSRTFFGWMFRRWLIFNFWNFKFKIRTRPIQSIWNNDLKRLTHRNNIIILIKRTVSISFFRNSIRSCKNIQWSPRITGFRSFMNFLNSPRLTLQFGRIIKCAFGRSNRQIMSLRWLFNGFYTSSDTQNFFKKSNHNNWHQNSHHQTNK